MINLNNITIESFVKYIYRNKQSKKLKFNPDKANDFKKILLGGSERHNRQFETALSLIGIGVLCYLMIEVMRFLI